MKIPDSTRQRLHNEVRQCVRVPALHSYSKPTGFDELTTCWGRRGLASSYLVLADPGRVVVMASDYDNGPRYWVLDDAELAARVLAAQEEVQISME